MIASILMSKTCFMPVYNIRTFTLHLWISCYQLCILISAAEELTSEINIGEYGRQWEERQQNPANETPDISTRGCRGEWCKKEKNVILTFIVHSIAITLTCSFSNNSNLIMIYFLI